MNEPQYGIVMLVHGSRERQWFAPFERLRESVLRQEPDRRIEIASLQLGEPDLGTAVARLVGSGVTRIRVVPMFWSSSGHVRRDLPERLAALRAAFPQAEVDVAPAIGETPLVLDAIVQALCE